MDRNNYLIYIFQVPNNFRLMANKQNFQNISEIITQTAQRDTKIRTTDGKRRQITVDEKGL